MLIKCKCGKNQMNFKHNIGTFYVDVCCTLAGYDDFGNLKEPIKLIGNTVKPSPNNSAKLATPEETPIILSVGEVPLVDNPIKVSSSPKETFLQKAKRKYVYSGKYKQTKE